MSTFKAATSAAALIAATAASPALADVTAEQVWENWKAMLGVYGEGLTIASEDVAGDTVTVTGISMTMEDGTDTVTAEIGEMVFTGNGDGTVSVTMSEENPITFTSDGTTVPLMATSSNLEMTVSGTPEEMAYAVTADSYALTATPGTYDEVEIESGSLTISDIEGTYSWVEGDLMDLDYTMNASSIVVDVTVNEPGGTGTVVFDGQIDGLTSMVDASIPADIAEMENPDAVFVEGFTLDASYEFGASNYAMNFDADGDTGQGTASSEGGSMAITMSDEGITYSGGTMSPMLSATGFQLPFPVEIALDEISYAFDVPLAKSEEPQDMSLSMALRGLTINDILWSMVDPGEVLPRDPATVAIDLSGMIRPLYNYLDPEEQMAAAMDDMPVEIHELTLNDLEISAAGAQVTGSGGFTFDNSDLTTFNGVPKPTGQVTIAVNGANGLMDKLVQMGLLPEQQVMGARMMLGMFATPVGEDQLESVIEINEQGHLLANGQRLQ